MKFWIILCMVSLITIFSFSQEPIDIIKLILVVPLLYVYMEILPGLNLKLMQEDCLISWKYSKSEWKTFLRQAFKVPPFLYCIQGMVVSEPYVLIYKNGITINGLTYPLAKDSIHKLSVYHFTISKTDIYYRNNINILEIRYYGSDITTEETIKIPIPVGEEENAKKVLNYFSYSQ